MMERTTLQDCFRPAFWKQLRWFALVEAHDDVLPIRAKFGKSEDCDPTLGWDFLISKQPFWVTGPDAIAAKLMTGKPLKILEAIEIVPHGVQPGLMPVKLHGHLEVNPLHDDLAVKLIELRSAVNAKNPKLAGGLKVAANSAAFGLLCQLNVKELSSASPLQVFSGEADYRTPPVEVWEQPAEFYCPVIASLVTGGSHLLCAMLERKVRDMGGQIAAMDTDSAMIVSTKNGGLVPCAGGEHRLEAYRVASGHSAIRALSFAAVDHIRDDFEALNLWHDTLKVPFLRLEAQNLRCSNGLVFSRTFSVHSVVTVPFPNKEINQLWTGYFIMPYTEKLDDLHGRPMVNVVSGGTFYIYDKSSSTSRKSSGWLSLRTMEDEINHLLSRAESKFCTPNGSTCTSKTIGLLVRRHIVAGEFHYVGKEASTRWAGGPDLSMVTEAGVLEPTDDTFREYERVVDAKYLEQIRAEAKEFSTKRLSRQSKLAECAIRSFKNGKNTIRPRSLRKLVRAIHDLQNKNVKN